MSADEEDEPRMSRTDTADPDPSVWTMSAEKWEADAARAAARGDDGAKHAANRRAFTCELRALGVSAARVDALIGDLTDLEYGIVGALGRGAVDMLWPKAKPAPPARRK